MTKEIPALAQERQISTYDASYLDLAMRTGLPIATQDAGLKKAARASGVPIFKPA
jgi:predicted nucleic acid-binding protein